MLRHFLLAAVSALVLLSVVPSAQTSAAATVTVYRPSDGTARVAADAYPIVLGGTDFSRVLVDARYIGDGRRGRSGRWGAGAGVVPNPARGAVQVLVSLATPGTARVELYDALGRQVASL